MDLFQFLEFLIQCALNRIRIRKKEKKDSYPVIWIRVLRPELFILVRTRKPVPMTWHRYCIELIVYSGPNLALYNFLAASLYKGKIIKEKVG